jgi:hypothetical protein
MSAMILPFELRARGYSATGAALLSDVPLAIRAGRRLLVMGANVASSNSAFQARRSRGTGHFVPPMAFCPFLDCLQTMIALVTLDV